MLVKSECSFIPFLLSFQRVATNTSTKEYTEPARDEQSLYSQFKSLKLNLVKKNAVK